MLDDSVLTDSSVHGRAGSIPLRASYLREVVKKRIEYAMLPGGWRDRDFLHKLVGLF
jgi:hypothetical protein